MEEVEEYGLYVIYCLPIVHCELSQPIPKRFPSQFLLDSLIIQLLAYQ